MRTDPAGSPTEPVGLPSDTDALTRPADGSGLGDTGRHRFHGRRSGRPGARRAGGGAFGWLANAIQLTSDRNRQGQEAFSPSPFSRLMLTHALSMAGDALVTLALAGSLFFNISPHAARGRVALSLVLTMAPFAIVAPFLGPIIDRTKGGRRLMVLLTAGGRAVACLMMARYIHGLLLFPAAFITLVCSKGYVVAKAALVPGAVERPEDLIEANSKLAVGGAIVGFLAAVPGVAILKLLSAATLLRVDALVFVVCGLSALRIRPARPLLAERAADGQGGPEPGGHGAPSSSGPPGRAPRPADRPLPPGVLELAAAAVGSLRFTVGFLTFLVAFAFRRGHAAAWWYGVVLAASVGGNLVGAVIAPRLRGRIREEHILTGSVAAVAITGLIVMQFGALHGYPAAALLAAVLGIGAGSAKLAFDSLVQREVPAAVQGRAFARFEAVFQLVWVVGGLAPVLIPMTLNSGFIVCTAVTTTAVLVYQVGGWLGRRDRLPAWWPGVAPSGRWPEVDALGGAVGGGPAGSGGAVAGGAAVSGGAVAGGAAGDGAPGGRPDAVGGGLAVPGADGPTFGPAGPRPVPPPLSGLPPRPGLDQ